jgi:hypothetical protein
MSTTAVQNHVKVLPTHKTVAANLPYEVVCEHKWVNPHDLKFDAEYQRQLEPKRLSSVQEKISKDGYKPHEVLAVNEFNTIIDGQHRARAAINLNIEYIPITIYSFNSKKDEARFFVSCNDHNSNLNNVYYWNSQYQAGDALAVFIYNLESDPLSELNNNIKIKGKTGRNRFSIPEVLSLMTPALNVPNNAWTRSDDKHFKKTINNNSYEYLREQVNEVVGFFYDCFGRNRVDNPQAFKTHTIRPFTVFYKKLKKKGLVNKSSANKMKNYVFTNEFNKLSSMGKVNAFVSHFNEGRTKNKIEYYQN